MSHAPTVTLRASTDADADLLFQLSSDLDTWEERTPGAPAPMSRRQFESRVARATADLAGDGIDFVVDVDGAAVGSASLFGFDHLARHAEAGINLVPGARGHGVGTTAIGLLVEFGFVRRNLRRIHLQAISSNVAALRAYEKAGFVLEGRQRDHAWVRGAYQDIVLMGVLRSEWSAAGTDKDQAGQANRRR